MAPSFENLDPETEYDDNEEEVDFSGMRQHVCGREGIV